ncbi:MAG: glycosyltransferase family 39 protein [Candidatus Omnitrophica bacterium]|nr:glycosyltransferase family 39 protein [Candidatus Omnitrophota bacterium]
MTTEPEPTPPPEPEKKETKWVTYLAVILIAAFVLRYAYVLQIETPPFSDMADYETMALNLLDGQGLVMNTPHMVYKAYRPPLYPLFIAASYKLFGPEPETVRMTQVFLSTLTVLFVFLMTREIIWGFNPERKRNDQSKAANGIALIAAAFFALEESSIFLVGQLLSETLFVFLLVLFAYLILRGSRKPGLGVATLLGLLGGFLILTRPLSGPLFLFGVYWFFMRSRKYHAPPPKSWKEFSIFDSPYAPPIIMVVYAAVIVMCWGIRNQAVLGEFVPVSTNGGVNFYLGHHEGFGYHSFGRKEDIRRALRAQGIDDEVTESKIFTQAGLEFIHDHPGEDFRNAFKKLDYLYLEPADVSSLFQPWKWWSYLDSPYRPWPWETNDRELRFWPVKDEQGKPILPTYQRWFWQEGRVPLVFWGWPMIILTVFGFFVGMGRLRKLSFPFGLVFVYTLCLLFFFTNARFRAPIIPFLYIFAAVGVGKFIWGLPEETGEPPKKEEEFPAEEGMKSDAPGTEPEETDYESAPPGSNAEGSSPT